MSNVIFSNLMIKQQLILLHGALCDATMFKEFGSHLEKDFEIFSVSFSGHGKKEFTIADFSIQLFADELEQFIIEKKLNPATIFGYSMGGYVALWLARFKPSLVKSVFTLATKLIWNAEIAERECKMLSADKMEEKIPVYAALLKERHGADWKKTVKQMAALITNLGLHHLINSDFKNIKAHVHLAIGDMDNMVTQEETTNVQSLISGSTFSVLDNTQHAFEKTDVTLLVEALKKHILPS